MTKSFWEVKSAEEAVDYLNKHIIPLGNRVNKALEVLGPVSSNEIWATFMWMVLISMKFEKVKDFDDKVVYMISVMLALLDDRMSTEISIKDSRKDFTRLN